MSKISFYESVEEEISIVALCSGIFYKIGL